MNGITVAHCNNKRCDEMVVISVPVVLYWLLPKTNISYCFLLQENTRGTQEQARRRAKMTVMSKFLDTDIRTGSQVVGTGMSYPHVIDWSLFGHMVYYDILVFGNDELKKVLYGGRIGKKVYSDRV